MRVGNSREIFFTQRGTFPVKRRFAKREKKMSRTSLSMSHGNQSTKYAVNARTRISSVPLVLVSGAFFATWTRRGFRPRATPRARAGHFRRVSENSGKVRALVGNISPARSHRTAPSSPFTSGWFFMRPLTCSLEPWWILRWTFRGALDVARARTFSFPPSRSDFAVSAAISARAARASLPTRASLAGRSSPSHDTPSRTTRGT